MKKKYTVDEIIDGKFAVLLDRQDESKKIDVALSDIPIKVSEGDIINLELKDGKVISAEINIVETENARNEARDLIEELKKKSSKELKW